MARFHLHNDALVLLAPPPERQCWISACYPNERQVSTATFVL
jgi:hypothetical protein